MRYGPPQGDLPTGLLAFTAFLALILLADTVALLVLLLKK